MEGGFVARLSGSLLSDSEEEPIEFLMENSRKDSFNKEKFFGSRDAAVVFLRSKHYTEDDLRHMIWIDLEEMKRKNLFTGEYLTSFQDLAEDGVLIAMNFWKCEECLVVYRTRNNPSCFICGSSYRFNMTAQDLVSTVKTFNTEELLTNHEKEEIKELRRKKLL